MSGSSHVPPAALSVAPWRGVPVGAPGATRLIGGCATRAVGAETAVRRPSTLIAVTTTRISLPTSSRVRVYVGPFALRMSSPSRCHWNW